jgi:hypothetical protein
MKIFVIQDLESHKVLCEIETSEPPIWQAQEGVLWVTFTNSCGVDVTILLKPGWITSIADKKEA